MASHAVNGLPSMYYNGDKHKPARAQLMAPVHIYVQMKPLLLLLAAFCCFFSILGIVRIHETLNVAVAVHSRSSIGEGALQLPYQTDSLVDRVPHRLLLATHNVLAWYYPQYDTMEVLHRGEGVHYGMFPGNPLPGHPSTVWTIIRPHNWRPTHEKEFLVQFDSSTGVELNRVEIPSRFSHDAVRVGDFVYVCSTGDGTILQLSYPDMQLVRSMPLFSDADHPNTLAAAPVEGAAGTGAGGVSTDHLWVVLHNLGASDLVKVYVGPDGPAHEVSRIKHIGRKAHGLVAWGLRGEVILLDSDNGYLISLDPNTGDEAELWQVPEEEKFLKGLAVLDDIAYFGITTWSHRSVRDSPDSHGELAAFDLIRNKLLWRRVVQTSGLLNIIGAPHLAVDSTYTATYTPTPLSGLTHQAGPQAFRTTSGPLVLPDSQTLAASIIKTLSDAGLRPPLISPTGYWSSGWPRLDIAAKLTAQPEAAGLQLPLFHADVSALRAKLLALPETMWGKEEQAVSNVVMTGRNNNMDQFKPGVEGIMLLFSDNEGSVVYQFPYYEYFRQELEPLLLETFGPIDIHNIVRIQLARMPPGTSDIKLHIDSGGYAKHGHRIHVPLVTNPNVAFVLCPNSHGPAIGPDSGAGPAAAAGGKREADKLALRPGRITLNGDYYQQQLQGKQQQQQQQQQQDDLPIRHLLKKHSSQQKHQGSSSSSSSSSAVTPDKGCVQIPAPEGLVFELNNRVQHKVSNPGPGNRIHLVIDVFEDPKPRTLVPPGSVCEYGAQLTAAQQLSHIQQLAAEQTVDEGRLAAEVEVLLTSPGMSCVTPDKQRIMPKIAQPDAATAAAQQKKKQELVQALLASVHPQQQGQLLPELATLQHALAAAQHHHQQQQREVQPAEQQQQQVLLLQQHDSEDGSYQGSEQASEGLAASAAAAAAASAAAARSSASTGRTAAAAAAAASRGVAVGASSPRGGASGVQQRRIDEIGYYVEPDELRQPEAAHQDAKGQAQQQQQQQQQQEPVRQKLNLQQQQQQQEHKKEVQESKQLIQQQGKRESAPASSPAPTEQHQQLDTIEGALRAVLGELYPF